MGKPLNTPRGSAETPWRRRNKQDAHPSESRRTTSIPCRSERRLEFIFITEDWWAATAGLSQERAWTKTTTTWSTSGTRPISA